MRQLAIGILLILSSSVARAADYSDGIKHAIAQLGSERSSDGRFFVVGGVTSNMGGVNGTFFLLYPFFLARATPADVELMLHDQNPVVRILGARRELEPAFRPLPLNSIDFLAKDQTQVRVGPFYPGGDFKTMTVGAVIEEMKKNPGFLFKPYYGESVRVDSVLELQPLRSVQAVERPLPVYPAGFARAGISGWVVVRFAVGDDGTVSDISIVQSSHRDFEASAKEAVSRWKFSRLRNDGEKKDGPAVLECRFTFTIDRG